MVNSLPSSSRSGDAIGVKLKQNGAVAQPSSFLFQSVFLLFYISVFKGLVHPKIKLSH